MNNRFSFIILSIILVIAAGLFVPAARPVLADGCSNIDKSVDTYGVASELPKLPKYCTTGQLTRKALNVAFALIGGIAVLFVVIGGYRYITAGGNAEAAKKGLQTVLYALVGLAAVILAVTAVNLVVNLLLYNKAF